MSEITISRAVIHELVKIQHKPIQSSNLRDRELDVHLETLIKLVEGIISLYGKRNNAAHFGVFRNGEGRGRFPDAFEKYAQNMTPENNTFLDLSITAMNELHQAARHIQSASGGYMLFVDYANSQGRFYLVAMIKQKDGLTLSEQLVPEELSQLDLSRLYQAARINFGKLSAYKVAKEPDKQELNYLSFVSPSSFKSAAGYFVTALGCTAGTASARATDTIIRESISFFKGRPELNPHRLNFKNDLMRYLTDKQEKGESVRLSEVENLARKYMPAAEPEMVDSIADEFITHLNCDKVGVPVEFPVNKTVLKKHRQIVYKADNWDLSFERIALGIDDDALVQYDEAHNRIIMNKLPQRLVEQIKEELNSRIE